MAAPSWSLYVVRRADGALYTGITTDVGRRLAEHAGERPGRGARCLRGRGPLELVLARRVGTRAVALRVESRFKRLSKAAKEALVVRPRGLAALVAEARGRARAGGGGA